VNNNDQAALWNTLRDVIEVIERSYPPEKGGGLLMASEMFISYFKRPPHEITLDMMLNSIKLLPLYLSWRRLPLDLIDLMVAEGERLVTATKLIEQKRRKYKQPKRKTLLRLDESDLSRIYVEKRAKKTRRARENARVTRGLGSITDLRPEVQQPRSVDQIAMTSQHRGVDVGDAVLRVDAPPPMNVAENMQTWTDPFHGFE
jgi:hypothetical protein